MSLRTMITTSVKATQECTTRSSRSVHHASYFWAFCQEYLCSTIQRFAALRAQLSPSGRSRRSGLVPLKRSRVRAFELLTAPRKKAGGGYLAHRARVHEARPHLLKLRQAEPVAGNGLRIRVIFRAGRASRLHQLFGSRLFRARVVRMSYSPNPLARITYPKETEGDDFGPRPERLRDGG